MRQALRLAARLAIRELRGGARGMRIVLACLALGVAVIASVGTLRQGVDRGLAENGRSLLGGDVEIDTGSEAPGVDLLHWIVAQGGRLSNVVTMRSLLVADNGERQLVELKAVDEAYPLVGAVGLAPPLGDHRTLVSALATTELPEELPEELPRELPGIMADAVVLDRLGVRVGDVVRLGTARFRVAAVLVGEPDRTLSPFQAPRVMISNASLPGTGLVQPGSMLAYAVRVVFPAHRDVSGFIRAVRAAFPDTGWRVRDAAQAAPGVTWFMTKTALFMTLVGLTALLVGGIGVATGVRAWLEARARSIATLRCLGASSRQIFQIFLFQVLALCLVGIGVGVLAGVLVPMAILPVLADVLPVPGRAGVYPQPLVLAGVYGVLTTLIFALPALARAAHVSGAALFRDVISTAGLNGRVGARSMPVLWLTEAALVALLVALVVGLAPMPIFAIEFCLGAGGALLIYRGAAHGVGWIARHVARPSWPAVRLGMDRLGRRDSPVGLLLVSLGLGLSTLAVVALIEANLRDEMMRQLPANAPSFYFIDIQDTQLPRFMDIVRGRGVAGGDLHEVPSLRARIVAVKGVPTAQVQATPETQWALRGDRGLTIAATPPENTRLVAGTWWAADYDGPPLVSFDAQLAKGWGVTLGDTLRVRVLGRDIDLKVASLRDIAWRSLGLNFAMVASPGLLDHAPHAHIATVRVPPEGEGPLLRAVSDALPNVTGIRVTDVLAMFADMLGHVAAALMVTGGVTLLAGALVLAGAIAAGHRQRVQEIAVLRCLGATSGQIRLAWLVEFGAIGLAAGAIAACIGSVASWGVMRFVMQADWHWGPGVLAITLVGCMAAMMLAGALATELALRVRPARLLRAV